MKKQWMAALLVGAVAVTAGAMLISKKGKNNHKDESAWYPTLIGYCGDLDVMSQECNDGLDNPTILRDRSRV